MVLGLKVSWCALVRQEMENGSGVVEASVAGLAAAVAACRELMSIGWEPSGLGLNGLLKAACQKKLRVGLLF